MRIGSRITITTSALVALSLGLYGMVSIRDRRADLMDDAEQETRELSAIYETTLIGALREGGMAQLRRVSEGMAERTIAPFEVETIVSLPEHLDARLRRMIAGDGVVVERDARTKDGRPAISFTTPIHDRAGQIVAALELRRDLTSINDDVRSAGWRVLVIFALLTAILGLGVAMITRRSMTRPLGKLIDGIDGVARGDLSRVILEEREDEIGALASRFNEMTTSLREAREETRRGSEAKLELEERLRQAEKLATIGQLAAEIAHEVGTPLNVITGRASVMARKAGDEAEVRKNAGIIADQTQRITRIIQQLLDFARRKPSTRIPVDVGRLATAALDFLEHKLAQGRIRARVEVEPGLPEIPGDSDQVQQICLNLLLNAIQAMPDGGQLEVRVKREHRKKPGLEMAPASGYVVIEVADTGVGIAPEDREKIFEPFYSTKSQGEGTGLGLSVSHGIVNDHDGWIDLEAREKGVRCSGCTCPSTPPRRACPRPAWRP